MTAQPGTGAPKQHKVNPAFLVALGVVALGAVIYLVASLGGGGPEQAAPAPEPAPTTSPTAGGGAAGAPQASPTGSGGAPEASPPAAASPPAGTKPFELSEARDPFRPLVVPAPEGATPGGSPAPSPAASPAPGAGGAPAPEGGEAVELLDVIVDDQGIARAQVRVGTTVSTVAAGETFSGTYEIQSIEGACATLRHGDDIFTLCRGDQVRK